MSQNLQLPGALARLSLDELTVFESAFDATIEFEGGDVIAKKGDKPFAGLLASGHLCRRRTLREGARQLLPVAIPGDLYGALDLASDPIDFEIVALSGGSIKTAPLAAIPALFKAHPSIRAAWLRARQLEETILRERVVSLGGRPALSRLAHLFCEFVTRSAPNLPQFRRGGFLPIQSGGNGAKLRAIHRSCEPGIEGSAEASADKDKI